MSTLAALEGGTDTATALAFFDALPAVSLEDLRGSWRGRGLPTGHPLDGFLERYGWHGKRFGDPDDAHPLVFDGGKHELDPRRLPLGLAVRHARWFQHPALAALFKLASIPLRTRAPRARLRMLEYRGVVSAAMIYDALPIQDLFRKVDADTVLGVMDLRGMPRPFFFILARE